MGRRPNPFNFHIANCLKSIRKKNCPSNFFVSIEAIWFVENMPVLKMPHFCGRHDSVFVPRSNLPNRLRVAPVVFTNEPGSVLRERISTGTQGKESEAFIHS